jgi:hypothetical protein
MLREARGRLPGSEFELQIMDARVSFFCDELIVHALSATLANSKRFAAVRRLQVRQSRNQVFLF